MKRWIAFVCAGIGCVCYGAAQDEEPLPLSPKALLAATPVRSGDKCVTVRSSAAMEGYRAPVLMFVQRAREEFLRAANLKMAAKDLSLDVAIGNQRDGDTRVLAGRVRLRDGGVGERIELPDPEAADLALLRYHVWMALYRSWLVSASGSEAVLERLPVWLMEGAVRRMDTETWPADVDRALLLWSRACLPTAQDLLVAESAAFEAEPSLGAVLADYLMSRKVFMAAPAQAPAVGREVRESVLDALIREAAKGQAWDVERLAEWVTGDADALALDRDLDLWLSALGRKVLVPGLTTEGTVRRFRANLLIYPTDYGIFFDQRKPWMTFQELAASADPALRKAAVRHVVQVQMAVAGRDSTLLALAEAYSQFLRAVAAGKKPKEVNVLLMKAEAQRKGLEEALKGGKMILDKF